MAVLAFDAVGYRPFSDKLVIIAFSIVFFVLWFLAGVW